MEFWGVEVKSGETIKVNPGDDKILHLSQASLGEVKKNKENESAPLFVNIGGQKLVIGTLSPEKCAQITYDLVFEKEFELSHNWKHGSVYFIGYKSVLPGESEDFSDFGSDSEEEEIPLQATENGKPVQKQAKPATVKADAAKPDSSAAKPKVKIVEPEKVDKSKDDDEDDDGSDEDDDESDEDDSDDDESDEDMLETGDDSDEDDDSSDEDDEETPTPKKGKKRPLDSAAKTPASDKKAKLVTPQKTDGKKGGGHTATPHPNKQAAKTPANSDKKGQQTPKSPGQFSCKSCNKAFNSDGALQSHSKAKHSGGK
ncbi:histone deacetylase HDT1-like [Macadamia integrifolia]|uniref:histone deacetylase HDT1-like n=1 Tax=Macadamia integrifolia TaxID=60698 RepID=UPI001C4F785C|nr:histone deacetylase HDT1-like [Macadamia integrifolia]